MAQPFIDYLNDVDSELEYSGRTTTHQEEIDTVAEYHEEEIDYKTCVVDILKDR